MGYFRELPDLEYQSFLSDRSSSQEYLKVKNLFRRCRLREDLENIFLFFNKYEIVDGARPDNVAQELYGDPELDWVVLMVAGIVNVRDQWPLSNNDIYKHALNLYGETLNNPPRFYETREIKDSNGRLIIPEGKVVDEDFSIRYYDSNGYQEKSGTLARKGISNFEYELRKNEKKRTIYTLKPNYLQAFLNDMKQEMTYSKSSQYVNEKLIRTENTRVTSP